MHVIHYPVFQLVIRPDHNWSHNFWLIIALLRFLSEPYFKTWQWLISRKGFFLHLCSKILSLFLESEVITFWSVENFLMPAACLTTALLTNLSQNRFLASSENWLTNLSHAVKSLRGLHFLQNRNEPKKFELWASSSPSPGKCCLSSLDWNKFSSRNHHYSTVD